MESQSIKKILFFSDYGPQCFTGYGTVSRNIIAEMKKHFGDRLHIDVVAVNYWGPQYSEYDGTVNVVSAMPGENMPFVSFGAEYNDKNIYPGMVFCKLQHDNNYDGVFILQGLGIIASFLPLIKEGIYLKNKGKSIQGPPTIIYFPVDGTMQTKVFAEKWSQKIYDSKPAEVQKFFTKYIEQIKELSYFAQAVTFTDYGKFQMELQAQALKQSIAKIAVIPHGTNTTDFYPVSNTDKQHFRRKFFGKNAEKFIVGVINRNQSRKDIPTAIFGFAEAKKIWDREKLDAPFLYLHMNPKDDLGWNLHNLLSQTALIEGKDYMFTPKGDKNYQVDVKTLNLINNSIDVYLTTSLGEGWGLTLTEAMACKTPCIAPAHTSMKEIGLDGERAYMLTEFLPVSSVTDSNWRWMCHYEEVAEAIKHIAFAKKENATWLYVQIENAYNFVIENTWENVCKSWIKIWQKTFFES